MKSQSQKILEYLEKGNTLDELTAFKTVGCLGGFRARIAELRKAGHKILDKYIKKENSTYKIYYLDNFKTTLF
jgi:hypothetical protein